MAMLPRTKMLQFINWRVRVDIIDSRWMIGTLMAFDRHMNIILADTEEHRYARAKGAKASSKEDDTKELKRSLGLIIMRGTTIISITPLSPPAAQKHTGALAGGPGVGRALGRGIPMVPGAVAGLGMPPPAAGLPMAGIGGPSAGVMAPIGRGMPPPPGGFPGAPGMPPMGGMPPPGPPPSGFGMGQ